MLMRAHARTLTETETFSVYAFFICGNKNVLVKITVFWDVAPCSLVEVYRRFRGTCCLHHQGDHLIDGDVSIKGCHYPGTKVVSNVFKYVPFYFRPNI
jgi:hypothetical protein